MDLQEHEIHQKIDVIRDDLIKIWKKYIKNYSSDSDISIFLDDMICVADNLLAHLEEKEDDC